MPHSSSEKGQIKTLPDFRQWVRMISTGSALLVNPWHRGIMPKRSSPKRDFMEVGRAIVEQAIGEQMDGSPLPEPDTRNPHAVALGSIARKKGGRARAKSLTPESDPRSLN
jgi:hypothetical protein